MMILRLICNKKVASQSSPSIHLIMARLNLNDWFIAHKKDKTNHSYAQLVGFGSLPLEKVSQLEDLGLFVGCQLGLVERGISSNPILFLVQNSQIAIDKQDALQLELVAK